MKIKLIVGSSRVEHFNSDHQFNAFLMDET